MNEESPYFTNSGFNSMEDIPLRVFPHRLVENKIGENNQNSETEFGSSSTSHLFSTETSETSQRVVTSQPARTHLELDFGNRRPIPVSIIDREEFGNSFHAPINGIDFMRNADQLIIQQSCDITDLMANTENRYTVKVPRRETADAIYYATESSKECYRTCFGSGRAFSMRLYDRSDQEAMSFQRRLACGYCTFCPRLQELEVWIPPGELVGIVWQKQKPLKTCFVVSNRHGQPLYQIEGTRSFSCFHEAQIFKIYTFDGSTQVGTIVHQWDPVFTRYQLLLQMPSSITDCRHKALLLGSAFLLEYMFFENAQKNVCLTCIC